MQIDAHKQKKILDILGDLPSEKLDAVIDFAEHLKEKGQYIRKAKKRVVPMLPTYHLGKISHSATDRDKLYKDYLDRKFD